MNDFRNDTNINTFKQVAVVLIEKCQVLFLTLLPIFDDISPFEFHLVDVLDERIWPAYGRKTFDEVLLVVV